MMVVSYLERIRNRFQEEQIDLNTDLSVANLKFKENVEIIKFLESSIDRNIESFTPRQLGGFNLRKVDELRLEQEELTEKINMLNTKLTMVTEELTNLAEVIKIAKENDRILKNMNE